jgi:flagellar biosynthesis protein FlhF
MKLTKVEAASMQEALRKIRTTLGDDAMIVGTRTLRRGGVLGVGSHEVVEVYVADQRPRLAPGGSPGRRAAEPGRLAAGLARPPAEEAEARPEPRPEELETLSRALGELRQEIRELVREKGEVGDHPFLRDAYGLLLEREVEPKLAARLVGQLQGLPLPVGLPEPSRVRAVVAAQLKRLFLPNVAAPVGSTPRVVVLIGPTGVGKTTTIAKLAARAKLVGGQRVALVTMDTFRIAAVDQLQKYAQIIGVPLAIASDPVEFQSAVATFKKEEVEVVFVDSAGRSQRDELKMGELREFLQVLPGAEVHLVLSTTTHPRTMKSVAERFKGVGFQRVILTKLDEASSFGTLLEALLTIGKPVSFLTDGQNVPDDLIPSDPDRLAELVLRTQEG